MTTTPSAEELLRLALDDPGRARATASELLDGPDPPPPAVEAGWCLALAQACLRLGAIDDAGGAVDRGLRAAAAVGDGATTAALRRLRAGVLTESGRTDEALAELTTLVDEVPPDERGAVLFSRATVLLIAGRMSEARAAYDDALPTLEAAGDQMRVATLHANRANTHRTAGRLDLAERDLRAASAGFAELGSAHPERTARIHLATLLAGQGRLAEALRELELVRSDDPGFALDEGHVLLDAHLLDEAVAVFGRAAEGFLAEGRRNYAGAALVGVARAELLRGESDAARAAAGRVADLVEERSGHAVEAAAIEQLATGAGGLDVVGIERLDEGGRTDVADALRVRVALDRLERGRGEDVGTLVHPVLGRTVVGLGGRMRRHLATATLAAAEGRSGAARRSVAAGLAVLARHQAALGAVDLRAEAQGHGQALGRLGLRLTVDAPAIELLVASERSRAGTSRLPRPPVSDDPELGSLLARLRAAQRGLDDPATDHEERATLRREVAALERAVAVRRRSRPGVAGRPTTVDRRRLRAASDGAALVSFVEVDGVLHRIDLVDGRCRRRRLVEVDELAGPVAGLTRSLARLADRRLRPSMALARRTALAHDAEVLADLLLDGCPFDRPAVIVPTGVLHAVPWACLPPLRTLPFVVASSLTGWLGAEERSGERTTSGVCAVAGPELLDAEEEVAVVAEVARSSRVLAGAAASGTEVAAALSGATVGHFAAHGRFRVDNPLLSGVELHDGLLTVHDLESAAPTPPLVVLSACDLARAVVRPGDELLGLAAGLFALGTDGLVAAVQPVPDGSTRRLMVAFHEALAGGQPPAVALATARSVLLGAPTPSPLDEAAALAFAVLGAGHGFGVGLHDR